jgi:hypothetical protein
VCVRPRQPTKKKEECLPKKTSQNQEENEVLPAMARHSQRTCGCGGVEQPQPPKVILSSAAATKKPASGGIVFFSSGTRATGRASTLHCSRVQLLARRRAPSGVTMSTGGALPHDLKHRAAAFVTRSSTNH